MTIALWIAVAFCVGMLVEFAWCSRAGEHERARLLHQHEDECHEWFQRGIDEGRATVLSPALDLHTRRAQERILRLGGDRA